jgi:predicted thioesterase
MSTSDFTVLLGKSACIRHTVTDEDCARRWGNDLQVLATPVLLWLSEIAAMEVIAPAVPATTMTVGLSHDSAHLAPTPVGDVVTVTATLTGACGKRLTFAVEAADSRDTVLRGVHERAAVNRDRFLARLHDRPAQERT